MEETRRAAAGGLRRPSGRFNGPRPQTTVPITVATARTVTAGCDILTSRAQDISERPDEEVVVLVAHGPSSDEYNAVWLDNMSVLAERMRQHTDFGRIEHLTVRDDAPDEVQDQATAELRAVVEGATEEGKSVLIVPLLLSYGGIEVGIRERLEGLQYRMAHQALLPDDRLSEWVLRQVSER